MAGKIKGKIEKFDADKIKTGIPGFDDIVSGGLVKNSANLVSGGAGTGKTILCMSYLFNGAKKFGEKGMYISFEESEADLKADVAPFGINFDDMPEKVKFVYLAPYDLVDFIKVLNNVLFEFKPSRLVIDSLSALVMTMEDDFERRKEIFQLIRLLKSSGCTTLLVSEKMGSGEGSLSRYGIEEFLADSVIVLHNAGMGGESDRAIRVVKMRRSEHKKGPIPMEINKAGLTVLKSKY
jgi:circadian clock protein KaiC